VTKGERVGLLVGGMLVGVFVTVIATGIADRLGGQSWFGNGANIIQWISGPATFAAVAAGTMTWLNRKCAANPWCFRHGEHPVDGTLKKVCTHHHTLEHHEAVHAKHAWAHVASGRLGWGESHRPLTDDVHA
jgi:hypothetical protein